MNWIRHPRTSWSLALAVCAVWLFLPLAAAAQTATGATLAGRVEDGKKSPLPGVTVNATDRSTGFSRVAVTAADGTFRLPALPVGVYAVTAELAGFATVTVESVALSVATERRLEVTMSPAALAEHITVVDEAPLIQTSPSVGTTVDRKELENLPLNGRQFANLATLAPGTTLAVNSDPTKPGQQVVAMNGGAGRNVNYIIDGGDNADDTIGGALQNFNLESVQEFKIQTQQYKAEFGRSTGGVLSVVTKTGTNTFEGSVYGFFRDRSLNTRTESEARAGADKQPFKRQQYGAAFGGPIVQDKAHFFATWEKTRRNTSYTINSLGALPALDGQSVPVPFADELGTAKATYDISASQYLQVRFGYQKNSDKYGASPLAAPSALGTIANDYKSLLAGHTFQAGAETLNEALFQYTHFKNTIAADSNQPTIVYPSGAKTGQNLNTPQSTEQAKYQYKDDLSGSRTFAGQRHDWKVGFNYVDEPTLKAVFTVGLGGQYTLGDLPGLPVTNITIFGGFAGESTPTKQYSGYVQDDWHASDRLTVNAGVRYDYWDGFNLDQRSNPIWQTLATQTQYHESYLRDFAGGKQLKNDKNDFGPRLGFTWDTEGDGRRLLRGGWGLYYDFPYTNATILFPAFAVQSNYGVAYMYSDPNGIKNPDGTFFRPGQPLPPNQIQGDGAFPPNDVASPTLKAPRSTQTSLGYSWQVNSWLGLNFEAVDVQYRDLPFVFRPNTFVDANGNHQVDPEETRRFPQFGNFNLWYGRGKASYDGLNLGVHVRLSRFELQGFYTLSRATGNTLSGADDFRLTNLSYQPDLGTQGRINASVDPLNPLCSACSGPLNTDARHRVTLAGTVRAAYGIDLSGVFRYSSATPYLEYNVDQNGDGFDLDLPAGKRVNALRGASFSQLDLRIGKTFTFADHLSVELIGEVFNLLNAKNPAGFNGNRQSANFKQPTSFAGDPLHGEQRLGQLGLRVRF
ncbi:MAG TPA: TonB-dependent receptor [Thermoanaerobaculia bacterium]|jgi:outer membrane receptor protein involved in Fe transport|nr:TonB-dependent receptor [Thermoanaerobaculia bacterium]